MRNDSPRNRTDSGAPIPRIGNDIVSREDPWPRSPEHLQRYRRRVLTRSERTWAGNAEVALWMCWALKESTYKLEFAVDPRPYFRPNVIQCSAIHRRSDNLYHASVRGRHGMYVGRLRVEPTFVHAVVAVSPDVLSAAIWTEARLASTSPTAQSVELERELRTLVRTAGLVRPSDSLELRRRPHPSLRRNGRSFAGVSLSHHGNWAGIALCGNSSE